MLFAPGVSQGFWDLPDPAPRKTLVTANMRPIAPPATDGLHAALLLDERITAFSQGASSLDLHEARPAPWYPPAIAWPVVVWVDERNRGTTGTDIWMMDVQTGEHPSPLVQEPGDQRHVVGSGHWIGWVDDDHVWVQDLLTGLRTGIAAHSGFRAGITLWQAVVCWEDRGGPDVDIRCSDGLDIVEPGDQGWPSRWGPWLLYRQDNERTMLAVSPQAAPVTSEGQ